MALEGDVIVCGDSSLLYTCDPAPLSRFFDQYGKLALSDEKSYLDRFASELREQPGVLGYILAYGSDSHAGEVLARAVRARGYMEDKHGLKGRLVMIIAEPYRTEVTTELWIVPTGATPPHAISHSQRPDTQSRGKQ